MEQNGSLHQLQGERYDGPDQGVLVLVRRLVRRICHDENCDTDDHSRTDHQTMMR